MKGYRSDMKLAAPLHWFQSGGSQLNSTQQKLRTQVSITSKSASLSFNAMTGTGNHLLLKLSSIFLCQKISFNPPYASTHSTPAVFHPTILDLATPLMTSSFFQCFDIVGGGVYRSGNRSIKSVKIKQKTACLSETKSTLNKVSSSETTCPLPIAVRRGHGDSSAT